MKKKICSWFLALCLALSLTGTALAANETGTITTEKGTTITGFDGSTVTFGDNNTNENKVTVTYSGPAVQNGEQYLILMLSDAKADRENPEASQSVAPTASNILYIDQKAASGTSITFEVYPKSLSTGVILITGVDQYGNPQKLIAAIVKAQYILGDVDGSGEFNVGDVTALVRYLAGLLSENEIVAAAADADQSGAVNVGDITKVLRVLAHFESL